MKGDVIDQWIHSLMDKDLSPSQRSDLESRLRSSPSASSALHCEEIISKYLREIGKEDVLQNRPDFMWSQVKRQISEASRRRQKSGSFSIFAFPYFPWVFASLVVVVGTIYVWSNSAPPRVRVQKLVTSNRAAPKTAYGEVHDVETGSSDLNATSYESRSGNATVVWVNGSEPSSKFCEIWGVYSYKPEIVATSYQSSSGNATVIWVSGTEVDESGKTAVF